MWLFPAPRRRKLSSFFVVALLPVRRYFAELSVDTSEAHSAQLQRGTYKYILGQPCLLSVKPARLTGRVEREKAGSGGAEVLFNLQFFKHIVTCHLQTTNAVQREIYTLRRSDRGAAC